MSENKKYYYLKLKEDFFFSGEIIVIENMTDGILFSNILLKLYLLSLKFNGYLMLNEDIPYDLNMIANITRHQVGTVQRAIELFAKLHIIAQADDVLYMANIEGMVGSSSTEADRKRIARQKVNLLQGHTADRCPPNIHQMSKFCPPEIELEKEIEIKSDKESKREQYGQYSNVLLSHSEYEQLHNDYPAYADKYIKKLSEYMEIKGKNYNNHYATVRSWLSTDVKKTDYSCGEEESL